MAQIISPSVTPPHQPWHDFGLAAARDETVVALRTDDMLVRPARMLPKTFPGHWGVMRQ